MAAVAKAETPTGVVEVLSVETEVVLVEAITSPAFLLDVTSVEIHVRFLLNQTEVSRYCAESVSEETKGVELVALSHDARLIESHPLEGSMIARTIDQSVDLPQVQPRWVQA